MCGSWRSAKHRGREILEKVLNLFKDAAIRGSLLAAVAFNNTEAGDDSNAYHCRFKVDILTSFVI